MNPTPTEARSPGREPGAKTGHHQEATSLNDSTSAPPTVEGLTALLDHAEEVLSSSLTPRRPQPCEIDGHGTIPERHDEGPAKYWVTFYHGYRNCEPTLLAACEKFVDDAFLFGREYRAKCRLCGAEGTIDDIIRITGTIE